MHLEKSMASVLAVIFKVCWWEGCGQFEVRSDRFGDMECHVRSCKERIESIAEFYDIVLNSSQI